MPSDEFPKGSGAAGHSPRHRDSLFTETVILASRGFEQVINVTRRVPRERPSVDGSRCTGITPQSVTSRPRNSAHDLLIVARLIARGASMDVKDRLAVAWAPTFDDKEPVEVRSHMPIQFATYPITHHNPGISIQRCPSGLQITMNMNVEGLK